MKEQPPAALALEDLEGTPPPGTLLVRIDQLSEHGGKEIVFTEGGFRTSIFVQQVGDDIRVFLNYCPHAGTPLNMFDDKFTDTSGRRLLCRTHGALFDPLSGLCVRGPCKGRYLRPIAHTVKDNCIYSA